MNIAIRLARPADIRTLFDIRCSVRENQLSRAQLAEMGITPDAILAMLRAQPCIWIAEADEAAAGFAMADIHDACVYAAFVRPEWQGRGLGRRLMAQAEAFLFARHPRIWLETAGASRASGFYQKLGWLAAGAMENGDVRYEKHANGQAPHHNHPTTPSDKK